MGDFDNPFPLPQRPGDISTEEAMAVLVNPFTRYSQITKILEPNVAYVVPALQGRTQVIVQIQTAGVVWMKFGSEVHLVGDGMRLEFTMFGIGAADFIPVSFISDTSTQIHILQLGV